MNNLKIPKIDLVLVFGLTALIAMTLSFATYYINYWPTDSEYPYLPAAAKLFELPHISDIHNIPFKGVLRVNMHGKETLIVGIAILQKIFNDTTTLFPNVFLLIIAVGISAVLIYFICHRLWDRSTALIMFLLFTGCFWPYMYIIMGAHPPLGLMFFLLAVYLLLQTQKNKSIHILAGVSLGLMLFSTPTAPIYLIYYGSLFLYLHLGVPASRNKASTTTAAIGLTAAGAVAIFFLFTFPNTVQYIKDYFEFMHFSRTGNNFMLYKDYLERFFPVPPTLRGGGWLWIIKYGFLILPFIFPLYLFAFIYVFKKGFQQKLPIALILLSLTTPLIIEASRVVQFGRNYFSWYISILAVVAFCFYDLKENLRGRAKNIFWACTIAILAAHIIWNMNIFYKEIFAPRLVTTSIYDWCIKNGVKELSVYEKHFLYKNIVRYLNNPKRKEQIKFNFIDSIEQVSSGYILIPPINGKTIYVECRFDNFSPDPALTELYLSGRMPEFTVASFPSLAVSQNGTWKKRSALTVILS